MIDCAQKLQTITARMLQKSYLCFGAMRQMPSKLMQHAISRCMGKFLWAR